ncbi:prepilin-type N-terminal cleavage/methylation domain-containing protein [Candidatus Roizmanbacteria bacterium]|nr:prepilin-type N-terminal cleavage/methylation domain-containing protein [Candidatus Roizmanbacteria bacterium]
MKKGVTLIEMLIYMGLLSIILFVLTDIFTSVVSIQLESESASSVDRDGQYITSRYLYDMQKARDVTLPANLGDTTDSLAILVGSDTVTYSNVDGSLVLTNNESPNALNSSDTFISDMNFTRYGNANRSAVKFSFTVTSKIRPKSGAQSRSYQITQGLRPN